jgi:outer membrane protein assembly factor BamB
MKRNIPVLIVLVAAITVALFGVNRWRRTIDVPSLEKRVPLATELAEFARPLEAVEQPVRIGEYFSKSAGVPSKMAGEWPRFRGPNCDNIVPDAAGLPDVWPAGGPTVLWSVEMGEGYAGPVIKNGCAYILDYDGKENADTLRCLSMDDGKEIWRRWYKVRVKRNHGMSRTVPAVTDRHVVTIGPRCHVMCADAQNGDLKWGIDLEKELGATVPMWYTGQCPLIDGSNVVIAVGGKALLVGVDCETGKVVWQTPNERKWLMSHSSVVPMEIAGRKMYVYCAIGGIVAVSADQADRGTILWETDQWNHQVVAPVPVSIGDGRVFVTAGYGEGSAMFKVAQEGGKFTVTQVYRLDKSVFACEQHTPVFYRGYLYSVLPADAGSARKQAVCMSPDGKIMWASGSAERFGLGPFLVADNKILILEDNGVLTMIKASEQGFSKLARAKVLDGKEAWAPMAMAGGRLLIRDYGRMVCLDMKAQK